MKLTQTSLFILMLPLFCACSDNDTITEQPTPTLEHIAMEKPKDVVSIEVCPIGNRQIIGAGYDISAPYLSQQAIKATVVDIEKMRAQDRYTLMSATSTNSDMETFETAGEIPATMQANIREDSWFNSDFAASSCFSFTYICANYKYYIQRVQLMEYDIKNHPELIFTDEFLSDRETMTAHDIISKYGTHMMTDIATGLCVRSLYRTATFPPLSIGGDRGPSKEAVSQHSALSAMKKAKLPIYILVSDHEDMDKMHSDGALRVSLAGGNTALLSANPTEEEVDAWVKEGCTIENSTLLSFLKDPMPIYEVIPDKEKARAVKEITDKIIANKLNTEKTEVLLQSWENGQYKYSTTPTPDTEGGICAIPLTNANGRCPLYSVTEGNKTRLMTGENGVPVPGASLMLGYVYLSQAEGTVPLYEYQCDGYCYYTLKENLSPESGQQWKKTGTVGYVIPLTVE